MPEQIYIGGEPRGLKNDRTAFNIDNLAFPTLFNFYAWRGRIKRKRGTLPLGRHTVQVISVASVTKPWQDGPILTLDGSGNGSANLITLFSLGTTTTITPGSITLSDGTNTYTEPSTPNGTLVGSPAGTGVINYATGSITISGGASGGTLTGTFNYYPGLPVMGLEDFVAPSSNYLYPTLLSFDTVYSYQTNRVSSMTTFYNVNYYITGTPFFWSGADYQQFWTTNYSSALWATNNKPGMHIMSASGSTGGSPSTTVTFTFTIKSVAVTNLLVNDVIWFNEWTSGSVTINKITGIITAIVNASLGQYTVTFSGVQTVSGTGVAQVLTNSVLSNAGAVQDGIRYYTGDPTSATGLPTATNLGWVNFAPPLTNVLPPAGVPIDNNTPAVYYLVGALAILPYKDRILFFSPYIQTSGGTPIQLQDTVLWSWNGTPYYAVTGPSSLTTPSTKIFTSTPNIVPAGETANPYAYVVDQTGLGGYLPAGIAQPIITVGNNQDVLLIGFGGDGRKTRFVYTGNDLQPFLFFNINSELPSQSTYSAVVLDRGVIDIGQYGISMTDQQSSQRIDLDIPDSVFQIQALNFGAQRVNAIRNFQWEWIYFSYPVFNSIWKFPTQSFMFNYRDNTWSILYENYTRHGTYRPTSSKSWLTTGYKSWNAWTVPWNSGANSPQYPNIIAGNPQGWIIIKDQSTGEAPSGTISAISSSGGLTQITSYNHCVTWNNQNTGNGDYLLFQGVIGLLSSTITGITLGTITIIATVNTFAANQYVTISGIIGTTQLNGNTYRILAATGANITIEVNSTAFTAWSSGGTCTSAINGLVGKVLSTADANTFVVDIPAPAFGANGYLGLGTFTRLSQPLLQTKQFPIYWNEGRQTRLCRQMYLMETTSTSQVTLNIYLSQDPSGIWNSTAYNAPPNSLEYSQILYTCPESTNLGLTPSNINLQTPTALTQSQLWHRMNTSLIGETFQIGITLNDSQMRNIPYATDEIILHGIQLSVERGPLLS